MFIHLGSDQMIPAEEVVAILNIDSYINISLKEIIEIGLAERNLHSICSRERAKSLVITANKIYLSPISSVTLYKRFQNNAKGGVQ
ncbi:MAG: extracellular matrix regulator RemB [Bacillota bacterium]